MHTKYTQFTKSFSQIAGKSITFIFAVFIIIIWLITGPLFDFSDTWQLVINTATTIVTFIMVFIIQNTQNRDTEAMQVKLDELIRVSKQAKNSLLDLEDLDEDEIEKLRETYLRLAQKSNENTKSKAKQEKTL